jgi:CRISPR-associated protein Csx16
MSTWFITRHPGAIAWAMRQGLAVDRQLPHLDPEQIAPGDTVIGTLPVNLVARVCARGGATSTSPSTCPPKPAGGSSRPTNSNATARGSKPMS